MLKLDRIYAKPPQAGFRVLVDRLWPRGISKVAANLDLWAKDVAPTPALRQWFNHEPDKFTAFTQKYRAELDTNPAASDFVKTVAAQSQPVILLYGAKDEVHNHAQVLKEWLTEALNEQK
ncbi:DUF488 domain-containing protein [Lacticaseibacillus brantae]|uniref:Uroporphyrin-III C-methyltransferase n=1 Tax=Lacticaseibacillus brantae DSM 23927 TaxID=1423727 RepID=A0A0R2AYV1_9LACO|nr:DUF488 family protein [Lacticaseibacillus brantae]KRM71941.1 hypothetical protein FC34_GL000921 [Lacticaseibacillus brantae DSM 23927]